MKYMGSKARLAKHILPIMLKDRKPGQWFVEPFCGGCNITVRVDGPRIANDIKNDLILMYRALQNGWLPEIINAKKYNELRGAPESPLRGWAASGLSYCGAWWGSFAGKVKTKGGVRDYQAESRKRLLKEVPLLQGVCFYSLSYDLLPIPPKSVIYCDPPYAQTSGYKIDFNSEKFFSWCREKKKEGHSVFVSEYAAPRDFTEVWSGIFSSSLRANGKTKGKKESTEKLFKVM